MNGRQSAKEKAERASNRSPAWDRHLLRCRFGRLCNRLFSVLVFRSQRSVWDQGLFPEMGRRRIASPEASSVQKHAKSRCRCEVDREWAECELPRRQTAQFGQRRLDRKSDGRRQRHSAFWKSGREGTPKDRSRRCRRTFAREGEPRDQSLQQSQTE